MDLLKYNFKKVMMRFGNTKWEVRECHVGKACWCRMIFTAKDEEVIHEGAIDKEFAEYIVSLHNRCLLAMDTEN